MGRMETLLEKEKMLVNVKDCYGKGGNLVGKGENAGNQHFLHFPQGFQGC